MALDFEDNPAAYNWPSLAGELMPGTLVTLTSGGEKEREVKEQTSPSAIGAFTMGGKLVLAIMTYTIECANKEAREETHKWLVWFDSQLRSNPLPALDIVDPVLPPGITKVVPKKIGPWKIDKRTKKATVEITVKEWKKKVPFNAGPAKPKDALDKTIEDKQAQLEKARADAEAKLKALRDKVNGGKGKP